MIKVRTYNTNNFLVSLDKTNAEFRTVYLILRTLLSAYELPDGDWVLDYEDFALFKEKLDNSKLSLKRTANNEAIQLLTYHQEFDKLNEEIKHGAYNDKTRKLLEGKIKTDPYEDQYSGISYMLHNPRSGLLDVMGTGKSFQSLATVSVVLQEKDRALVVAPKSVLTDFEDEVKLHTYLTPFVLPAGSKKAIEALKKNKDKDWDILLVHPENLVARGKNQVKSQVAEELMRMPFKAILIDEFHMYKNLDKKRSQVLMEMLRKIKTADGKLTRVHPMTGTLVSENPVNAYFALQVIGKGSLPSLAKFEKYFTIKKKIQIKREDHRGKKYTLEIDKVVGYKNLDVLKKRLERCSIRRRKEDLKGFPEKTIQTRSVELMGKQATLYKQLKKDIKANVDRLTDPAERIKFFSENAKGIRLVQLLHHPQLIGEDCKSAKYEVLDSILEEVLSDLDEKIVLWTAYRDGVDLIYDMWNEKYGVMKLYGGVEIDEDLKNEFVHGNKKRIVAAIPQKAGTGVNFLARARTACFVDYMRSLTLQNQAVDRLHRRVKAEGDLSWLDKHRSKPCTIIFLEAKGTYDEDIREALKAKEQMSKKSTPEVVKRKK